MTGVNQPDEATRTALLDLEYRRGRGLIDGDIDALAELFDDELIHIHAPGLVHTKAMLLEHVATRRAYQSITRGELSIRVIGAVAIMVGPITNILRNPDGSVREQCGQVTQVAHRDEVGTWRFVNFQLTPLGEEIWGKLPSEKAADANVDSGRQARPAGL